MLPTQLTDERAQQVRDCYQGAKSQALAPVSSRLRMKLTEPGHFRQLVLGDSFPLANATNPLSAAFWLSCNPSDYGRILL